MPRLVIGRWARKSLLLLAGTFVLTAGDCGGPSEPNHEPIEGALMGGFYQRLFNGKQANELPSTSQTPVVQYQGTLCLFAGGNYSYGRRFWLYNSQVNGGVDHDVVYGTFQGDLSTTLSFTGTVSGGTVANGDTLNFGANQFIRHAAITPACEGQR